MFADDGTGSDKLSEDIRATNCAGGDGRGKRNYILLNVMCPVSGGVKHVCGVISTIEDRYISSPRGSAGICAIRRRRRTF